MILCILCIISIDKLYILYLVYHIAGFLVFSPKIPNLFFVTKFDTHTTQACWVLGSIGARPETTDALVAVLLREAELVETPGREAESIFHLQENENHRVKIMLSSQERYFLFKTK